jgi:murein DD-endopeptidase MepM/ murein hydrolase activator NlpD
VLSQIRKDRTQVQREMDRKLKAARELEDLVTQLVEADRIRREKEAAESKRTGEPPRAALPPGDFESRKGKLRWPVGEGTVVARFGPQRHPTLRTISQNTGIDIAVKPGSTVHAVAPGEVSRLWWLPSYGNMVIVNNYGGFRTIYTHLAEITVVEGQKLAEGEEIGVSGESLDGPRLHFEIWKEREKQNPEQWLGRP